LATSMSASKIPQTVNLVLAKASTAFKPCTSQRFHRPRAFH
jgi:hypothetical protein